MASVGGFVYSELADIRPIYCTGVASAYLEHGNLHVAYFQEVRLGDGTIEKVIVARLVIPEETVMAGRALVNFEIAAHRHVSGAMIGAGTA